MEGYYYGILRKYAEELKRKQLLKEQVSTSSSSSSTSSSSSSSLERYHQTTPLVCNQTNSVTSYNTMYDNPVYNPIQKII